MNTLDNLKMAFRYKSDNELRNARLIFKIIQFPWLVKVLSFLANATLKYKLPFKFLIKKTVFKVFCAGENRNDAIQKINYLNLFQVKSVLDYVSEGEKTVEAYEKNTSTIVENIKKLGELGPGNYVSVKLTGLEDLDFFSKLAANNSIELYQQNARYQSFFNRIDEICREAHKNDVIVYIDAEDRCAQDVFDYVVEKMMESYNKEKACIFNTLQMYLTDRITFLNASIEKAKAKKYYLGIKLVRGAYVEKERERAQELGIESPVFSTKEGTDQSFDEAVKICLENNALVSTCLATHNEISVLKAIDLINTIPIENASEKVRFSQLYGMSDHLTFNLADLGYSASKYLPYGEVEKAIPYLIRRAEENTSIGGQLSRELTLLDQELTRRRRQSKQTGI
jgi:proline dehydrogenase